MDNKPKTQIDSQNFQASVTASASAPPLVSTDTSLAIQERPSQKWKVALTTLSIVSVLGLVELYMLISLFYVGYAGPSYIREPWIGYFKLALLLMVIVSFAAAIANIVVAIKYLNRFHPKGFKFFAFMILIICSVLIGSILGFILVMTALS
ncbi:hypothetical protein H7X68_01740 [Candidatus Saccharibacteria bacterium]|nr:hypothetical protein [Candidatus Saccharibacteria bacterium]